MIKMNWQSLRNNRISYDHTKECKSAMGPICRGEKDVKDVECCRCGKNELFIAALATHTNPYVKIRCAHVYPDGVECGFQYSCGHSDMLPPQNNPTSTKSSI